jgi:ABC-type polysaccharide/polyol phosphate export permease
MRLDEMCADGERPATWRHPYFAMVLLIGAMFVSVGMVRALQPSAAARLVLGLLPVAAASYLIWTMMRWVRTLDELQQKIQAESLALAYTGTILIAIALNFLHKAGFRLPLGWEDGLPILAVLYALSTVYTQRRYQ